MKSKVKFPGVAALALIAVGSFSGIAKADVITVDAFASTGAGTPITIGGSATPQYSFIDGLYLGIFPALFIQGDNGSTVAFPFNGVTQMQLPQVATDIFGNEVNGDYQLAFNIGATAYTGFATVIGVDGGQEITTISYNPLATVPEPLTLSLFGAGLAGAAAIRRRKKAKNT